MVEPTHIYLGSPIEGATVAEFADGSNGLAYATFRKMLETFLNGFYAAHQLPRERYLEVRGDQNVMFEILWCGINY